MSTSAQEVSGLAKELGESIKQFKLDSEETGSTKKTDNNSSEKLKRAKKK
jgi:hypothetical protein